ncbi:MAG: 50S ribosomal protein L5, partial [Candidatus Epulonipiscium fishelsonii]
MSRLKETYNSTIINNMMDKFQYKNKLQAPKIEKIVINMGVGEAKDNAKVLENAVRDMQTISGQKPIITRAKKSV